LDSQFNSAKSLADNIGIFNKATDAALTSLFPAARNLVNAQKNMDDAVAKNPDLKELERLRKAKNAAGEKAAKLLAKHANIKNERQYNHYFGVPSLFLLDGGKMQRQAFKDLTKSNMPDSGSTWHQYLVEQCTLYFQAREGHNRKSQQVGRKNEKLNKALTDAHSKFAALLKRFEPKRTNNPIGINNRLSDLTTAAKNIASGKIKFKQAEEAWKKEKNTAKKAADAEVKKWSEPKHQEAEWNKFKQHPVFYLGTPYRNTVLPLIQFSK
jgi:hypothetical protein